MKQRFTNYRDLKKSVAFGVFKRYNKIKYLLRIKHFRGRAIHSPFMYRVVRKALMHSKKLTDQDRSVFSFFIANGFNETAARQLARIYTSLEFENCSVFNEGYNGEDFIILASDMDETILRQVEKRVCDEHRLACGVLNNIYGNSDAHRLWSCIVRNMDVVTVDLFNVGIVFFCEDLQKQNYKMKF